MLGCLWIDWILIVSSKQINNHKPYISTENPIDVNFTYPFFWKVTKILVIDWAAFSILFLNRYAGLGVISSKVVEYTLDMGLFLNMGFSDVTFLIKTLNHNYIKL